MRPGRWLRAWLWFLGVLHGVVLFAGFFAPYAPLEQDRSHPYLPPMRLHVFDGQGRLHARPFVYLLQPRSASFGEYDQDIAHPVPLEFFVTGAGYRLLGVVPCTAHLFGAENARIYLLGSDGFGRDLLSRLLYGGQISLLAGLLATGVALFVGLAVGSFAGYSAGWRDELLMRLAELFLALPWLYLLIGLRAFLPLSVGPTEAFLLVVLVIGAVGWARPARLVRGVVLGAKERDYVRAARGFGAGHGYILCRHVLPETYSVMLTQAAVLIPQYVLAEVTLSFLGLGVPEPAPSWGNLLAALQQYNVLASYWWMYLPALAMVPFFAGYLGVANALRERSNPLKIESFGNRR